MNVNCLAVPASLDATSDVVRVIRATKPPAKREKQPPAQQEVPLEKDPAPHQPPPALAEAPVTDRRDGRGQRWQREDVGAWNLARTEESMSRPSRGSDDARSNNRRAPAGLPSEELSQLSASGRADDCWLARTGNASQGSSPPEERGLHACRKGRASLASDGDWRRPGCPPADGEGRTAWGSRATPAPGSARQSAPRSRCAAR